MPQQSKAPAMSAEEAREFASYSAGNAATVAGAFQCGCKPYQDVFTFNRWKAQGYFVKRGEHGVKLVKVTVVERETDSGETEQARRLGRSVVFCRHQVEAKS